MALTFDRLAADLADGSYTDAGWGVDVWAVFIPPALIGRRYGFTDAPWLDVTVDRAASMAESPTASGLRVGDEFLAAQVAFGLLALEGQ